MYNYKKETRTLTTYEIAKASTKIPAPTDSLHKFQPRPQELFVGIRNNSRHRVEKAVGNHSLKRSMDFLVSEAIDGNFLSWRHRIKTPPIGSREGEEQQEGVESLPISLQFVNKNRDCGKIENKIILQ